MTGKGCGKGGVRKHTEIKSGAQRRLFGSELGRREEKKGIQMKGITTKELKSHLIESAGKKLPQRVKHKR